MSKIQRLDYFLWFKGEGFNKHHFSDAVRSYLLNHGLTPIQTSYGVGEVPEEDVGECPWDYVDDSSIKTKKKETK